MKKCFTINQMRTKEEITSYLELFDKHLYDACEIFYPYRESNEQIKNYTMMMHYIKANYPKVEMVLHLPHGLYNGLLKDEHLNAGSLEIMKAGAKYASQFGIKKLTLHLGHVNENLSHEEDVKKVIPVIKELALFAKQYNQVIMIENMPGKNELGYYPKDILDIIIGTKMDNVKFIFDTGHQNVSEFTEDDYLLLLKDYLYHIHYSDNLGERDEHKPMGYGNIDFDHHFMMLKEIGYNELNCMEVIYKDVEDLKLYQKTFKYYEDKYEK